MTAEPGAAADRRKAAGRHAGSRDQQRVFTLTFTAYLPHLVTSDDRLEGNARLQASASTAEVASPGLGGLRVRPQDEAAGIRLF